MGDFIEAQGSALLAHRLRRSSDRIVDQIGAALAGEGFRVPPRGASMLLLVVDEGSIGVVDISRRLRLSHPLIVRMAQRFEKLGLVTIQVDAGDARRRLLTPTPLAHREAAAIRAFNARVASLFDALFDRIDCDLIGALDRLDAALAAAPIHVSLAHSRLDLKEKDLA